VKREGLFEPHAQDLVHDFSPILAGVARRFDGAWPETQRWIERFASVRLEQLAYATEGFALCPPVAAIALVLGRCRRFRRSMLAAVNLDGKADPVGGLAGAASSAGPIGWRGATRRRSTPVRTHWIRLR